MDKVPGKRARAEKVGFMHVGVLNGIFMRLKVCGKFVIQIHETPLTGTAAKTDFNTGVPVPPIFRNADPPFELIDVSQCQFQHTLQKKTRIMARSSDGDFFLHGFPVVSDCAKLGCHTLRAGKVHRRWSQSLGQRSPYTLGLVVQLIACVAHYVSRKVKEGRKDGRSLNLFDGSERSVKK